MFQIFSLCLSSHYNDEQRGHPSRHNQYEKYFHLYNWSVMNFHVGIKYIEIFMKNNPNIVIKSYAFHIDNPHITKKQLLDLKKPFYFPTLSPEELKDKKVVCLIFVFPDEQVIADRLNKNNYDVGHIAHIVDINKFISGWRSENNSEYICDCFGDMFRTEEKRDEHINIG